MRLIAVTISSSFESTLHFLSLCLSSQRFSLMTCVTYFPSFNEGVILLLSTPPTQFPSPACHFLWLPLGRNNKPHRHSRHIAFICLALLFLWAGGGLLFPPFYVFSLELSVMRLEPPCPALGGAQTLSLWQLWLVQEWEYNPSSIRVFSLVDIEIETERDVFWLGLFSWKSLGLGCHFILCMKGHEFKVKQGRDKKSGNRESERETEYRSINPWTQQCLFPSISHFY